MTWRRTIPDLGVLSPAMKRLLATAIALAACDKTPSGTTGDHSGEAARGVAAAKHEAGEQTVATGDPCAKAQAERSEEHTSELQSP